MKYRRKKKKLKTIYFMIILVIILIALSSSYALFNTELIITGTVTGWDSTKEYFSVQYTDITVGTGYPVRIQEGSTYMNTFTSNIPYTVMVSMGNRLLGIGTEFTYENGKLTIPNVSGNLIITGIQQTETFTEVIQGTTEGTQNITNEVNITVTTFLGNTFQFINNSGKKIVRVSVDVIYNKGGNANSSSDYFVAKMTGDNYTQTGSRINVPKNGGNGLTLHVLDVTGNIPDKFKIDYANSTISKEITIVRQIVTITFAD